jgi:predicted nucleic acid-binding Zn ribbon protein
MSDVENRLSTHEAVCAERYTGINARLKRLEQILLAATGAIIMLLVSVVMSIR